MDKLNTVIAHLSSEMILFNETKSRKHRTSVRKILQQLKNECHSMRKEILGTTKNPVEEPVPPVVEVVEEAVPPVPPVVEEIEKPVSPEPVLSHPIPDSFPEPVKEKKVKEKKEKKEKKDKSKKRKKE
jgi:hypothetical protein